MLHRWEKVLSLQPTLLVGGSCWRLILGNMPGTGLTTNGLTKRAVPCRKTLEALRNTGPAGIRVLFFQRSFMVVIFVPLQLILQLSIPQFLYMLFLHWPSPTCITLVSVAISIYSKWAQHIQDPINLTSWYAIPLCTDFSLYNYPTPTWLHCVGELTFDFESSRNIRPCSRVLRNTSRINMYIIID